MQRKSRLTTRDKQKLHKSLERLNEHFGLDELKKSRQRFPQDTSYALDDYFTSFHGDTDDDAEYRLRKAAGGIDPADLYNQQEEDNGYGDVYDRYDDDYEESIAMSHARQELDRMEKAFDKKSSQKTVDAAREKSRTKTLMAPPDQKLESPQDSSSAGYGDGKNGTVDGIAEDMLRPKPWVPGNLRVQHQDLLETMVGVRLQQEELKHQANRQVIEQEMRDNDVMYDQDAETLLSDPEETRKLANRIKRDQKRLANSRKSE